LSYQNAIDLNLCIDIGNTNAKAGIFIDDQLIEVMQSLSDKGVVKLIKEQDSKHIIISSVKKGIGKLLQKSEKVANTIFLNHETPIPFHNEYGTPQTLGLDRIAAVAGGQFLYPNTNCLIVDIGTCMTYDLLDENGKYQGGGISPGVEMRLRAMHKFTSKLPRVSIKGQIPLIGRSTKECMQSGVYHGVLAELEGIILRYRQFFNDLTIIFCGGGANFFESKIKDTIFAVPNLVLIGLNRVLRYNLND
jgi:type III pantothenate kinase